MRLFHDVAAAGKDASLYSPGGDLSFCDCT